MLTRVKIENCYSLINVNVTLKPFTLLLGPNGAGKSDFWICSKAMRTP